MLNSNANSSPTPMALVLLAADAVEQLKPTTAFSVVDTTFSQFRERVWSLIEVAPDAASYTLAWNQVNLYAGVDLLEYEYGEATALDRLKEKVRLSVALLP